MSKAAYVAEKSRSGDRSRVGDPALARRLSREIEGAVLFDPYSRGRYATDASIYQIEPLGVVVPRTVDDVRAVLAIAREEGVSVLPRGGGTSQCGQTVGRSLVVDVSRHLDGMISFEPAARRARVQPGMVLDHLNAAIRPHGLMFPVDVSTASRATIGGMTGNNSCGARSIRYGNMVHNVRAIEAVLSDGEVMEFASVPADLDNFGTASPYADLVRDMRALAAAEAGEIDARFPKLLRRVGGYNLDSISPNGHNMARLLVGSEGTLGFFTEIELDLQPIPPHRVLGVCHFPTLHAAMASVPRIVALGPDAVELADSTMIDLARDVPLYAGTIDLFVKGKPGALLLVEFTGDDAQTPHAALARLVELMSDLGYPGGVVEAIDPGFQKAVWEVRKGALNIMMSMKGDGKPVSFIEDCAVPLEDLAAYTDRLTELFSRHGTVGTWYAHASVGCLHVRPILNMKDPGEAAKMRSIAEEAFAIVREYKGSHSGEHGDGLVRSEFHEVMFGRRMIRAFEAVKDRFDPAGLFNPGKIVHPARMDDRSLFRYGPDYRAAPFEAALDWTAWGGFQGAVEMCNNNGACRKSGSGVMCPSFRVTGEEVHLTRGRANSLRLALSGQLGADALASDEMAATLDLCLSCKGCRGECPTGVDMARMKIEVRQARARRHGVSLRDRVFAHLPRYAPLVARWASVANIAAGAPGVRALMERWIGISAKRSLPEWHSDPFVETLAPQGTGPEVVLLPDCLNTWFEPENLRAAHRVLTRSGYRVTVARAEKGGRPLCCGRTYLSAGMVDAARAEARRTLAAVAGPVARGAAVIGLEPSCLLTLRDEYSALLPVAETKAAAGAAHLFEEFLVAERAAGRFDPHLSPVGSSRALLHGHCHQKALGAFGSVAALLSTIPGLDVAPVESTCCGMAGAFGYEAEHYDISMKIGELDILPAMRAADDTALLIADGASCRHQIRDGAGREAVHVARVLDAAFGA